MRRALKPLWILLALVFLFEAWLWEHLRPLVGWIVNLVAWDKLKQTLKEHNLGSGPNACYRTKVGCLRICQQGPTMVVYPEGTWYHGMTADRIPRFVQQHLIEGRPVEEWVFARNPLPGPDANG